MAGFQWSKTEVLLNECTTSVERPKRSNQVLLGTVGKLFVLCFYLNQCVVQLRNTELERLILDTYTHLENLHINLRPVGVWRATRPVGGGGISPPPKLSRTTQRSDKRQTALDSPERELSKTCIF